MTKTATATSASPADHAFECGTHIFNAVICVLEDGEEGEDEEDAAAWAAYRLECALKRLPPSFAVRLLNALEADLEHGAESLN